MQSVHHQGLNCPTGRIIRGLVRRRHGFEVSIFAPLAIINMSSTAAIPYRKTTLII